MIITGAVWALRIPAIRAGYVIQGLVGVAMMGAMIYLMIYLQVARGVSATSAGAYLAFMAADRLGRHRWQAGLVHTSLHDLRNGLRHPRAGRARLDRRGHTAAWLILGELVLLGVGFGQLLGRLIMLVQQAAPQHQLGVAITGIRFFQNLGGTIGAAAFGSLLSRISPAPAPGPVRDGPTPALARDDFRPARDDLSLCPGPRPAPARGSLRSPRVLSIQHQGDLLDSSPPRREGIPASPPYRPPGELP